MMYDTDFKIYQIKSTVDLVRLLRLEVLVVGGALTKSTVDLI